MAGLIAKGMRTSANLEPVLMTKEMPDNSHVPRYLPLGMQIPDHDAYVHTRDGDGKITATTYKTGGVAGTTVATMTFAWSGSNLMSAALTFP
jgi:hypothetical protein